MQLSTARVTTLLLTLAAASTAFVPDLLDAAPPTLITLDAPSAPSAIEVADLRAAAPVSVVDVPAAAVPGNTVSGSTASGSTVPGVTNERAPGTSSTRPGPVPPGPDTTTTITPATAPGGVTRQTDDSAVGAANPAGTAAAPSSDPLLVSTVGDSSMMFMNAGLAAALGPQRWQPVPTEYAAWTNGTGGFDRHGCGPTGDSIRVFFSPSAGPAEPRFNHPPEPEHTCDWRRWIPGALALAQPDVVVASWGPTTMWGWERDGQMVDLTDPVIRAEVAQAYAEVRDVMFAAGVEQVIWVAYPPVVWRPFFERNQEEQPWSRPEVADELYELLSEFGDTVVDLRDMADPANFFDGLHFTEEASDRAAQRIIVALP